MRTPHGTHMCVLRMPVIKENKHPFQDCRYQFNSSYLIHGITCFYFYAQETGRIVERPIMRFNRDRRSSLKLKGTLLHMVR